MAAAAVVGVPAARAEERPQVDVDERAAQEDKDAAKEEKAAADREEQRQQFVADASKYGRRIEERLLGGFSKFTELIPPPDGDLVDGVIIIRTGSERLAADGTIRRITNYWKPGSLDKYGVVFSVIKDGVETVTDVHESEPGSIDVKPGDSRPVPPPSSSAVGKKPHTIDPKADGSAGRASGNHPDAPAAIADTDKTPRKETIVRDKVELAGGGARTEFGPIKLPNGSVIKPFDEVKPDAPGLPFRTGYDLESPDFDGAFVRITAYFDKEGKIAAVVGSVLKDGLETAITTKEFKPGALGGLKPGDTRPFDSSGGKNPSAWDPKPPSGSGSGAKGGGTQSTGSAPQNGSGPASNEGRPKPEPAPDDKGEDSPGSDTTKSSSEDSHPEYVFLGQGPKRENEDGSTSQNTLYRRTSDGVYVQTITKTQQDGTQSQEQHCIKDSEEVDCGGMTDEPACGSSCDHLAVFVWLFGCAGTECGTPPVAEPDRHCDSSAGSGDTTESAGGQGQGSTPREFSTDKIAAPHCPAGTRTGGPADYGNPYDPNAPDPPDPSQFPDPRDDGVTDPADPGEGENGPAPVAIFEMEEEGPDLGNELLDPVDPWTDDSAPSGDGPPTTGDAERRIP